MLTYVFPLQASADDVSHLQGFGVGTAAVGMTISTYALARLMMNLPAGILADRHGRKLLLVWGPAITALGEPTNPWSLHPNPLPLSQLLLLCKLCMLCMVQLASCKATVTGCTDRHALVYGRCNRPALKLCHQAQALFNLVPAFVQSLIPACMLTAPSSSRARKR